jgi:hypothetical protein
MLMTTVVVKFDGKAFVPDQPLSLPVGTLATVAIPDVHSLAMSATEPNSTDENDWQRIIAQIQAAEPETGTFEDTMRQIRMRP